MRAAGGLRALRSLLSAERHGGRRPALRSFVCPHIAPVHILTTHETMRQNVYAGGGGGMGGGGRYSAVSSDGGDGSSKDDAWSDEIRDR